MPNHQVNLTKRIQTAQGSRYCPIVLSANGRVKPDFVHVSGKQEHHREGAYYIEWREGVRCKRLFVCKDADDANERRLSKQEELTDISYVVAAMGEKVQ